MSESNNIWAGYRVKLRAVIDEDWESFHKDGMDTEAARFGDDIKFPTSAASLRERIEKSSKSTGPNIWLAIEEIDSGVLVGSTSVHGADPRHRSFEYGVAIFREHRKKKYATEAVSLVLRYYFRELGYHRVRATVYGFNEPSLSLQRSLGFIEEGRLRQNLFTNGQFHDEVIFGMLHSEFDDLEAGLPPVPFGQLYVGETR